VIGCPETLVCDVTPAAELNVPLDATAPSIARAFLRRTYCDAHHARVLDEAELLVSELITNGVEHGAPPIALRVTCDGTSGLRVAVRDGSPRAPQARDAGPEDDSGRGIALVDMLSTSWGVETSEQGKTTWFTLA